MDCNELVEVVTNYLEGALSQTDRARFDAHLVDCPYCVTYIEQMRATLAAIGEIPVETIATPARERLLSVFRDWKNSDAGPR